MNVDTNGFVRLSDPEAHGFIESLLREEENLSGNVIARMSLRTDTGKADEYLAIQPKQKALIFSDDQVPPIELAPGRYEVAKLVAYNGKTDRRNQALGQSYVCVCNVSDEPIEATLCLPDPKHWRSARPENRTVSSWLRDTLSHVDIRSMDGFIGAAAVRIAVKCDNAPKLMKVLGEISKFKLGIKVMDEMGTAPEPEPEPAKGFFRKAMKLLFDRSPKNTADLDVLSQSGVVTFQDLYDRTQLELARSIQLSLRKTDAANLYDKLEVRLQVERDIQANLEAAFSQMGLQIHRVAAFKFRCPEYEVLLSDRAALAFGDKKVDIEKGRAELLKRQYENELIKHEQEQGAERSVDRIEQETARSKIAEQILTNSEMNKRADQQQDAGLHLRGKRQEFERDQRQKDHAVSSEMKRKDLERDLAIFKQYQDSEQQKKIEFIKALKDVDRDKLLAIVAAIDPRLAPALIASKVAEAQSQRIEDQREHTAEIIELADKFTERSIQASLKTTEARVTLPTTLHYHNTLPPEPTGPQSRPTTPEFVGEDKTGKSGKDSGTGS